MPVSLLPMVSRLVSVIPTSVVLVLLISMPGQAGTGALKVPGCPPPAKDRALLPIPVSLPVWPQAMVNRMQTGEVIAGDATIFYEASYRYTVLDTLRFTMVMGDYGRWEGSYRFFAQEFTQYEKVGERTEGVGRGAKRVPTSISVRFEGGQPSCGGKTVSGRKRGLEQADLDDAQGLLGTLLRELDLMPDQHVGSYLTEQPGASGGGPDRRVALHLLSDRSSLLLTDGNQRQPAVLERGNWHAVSGKEIHVYLLSRDGTNLTVPEVLVFRRQGTRLVLQHAEAVGYGAAGLELSRWSPAVGSGLVPSALVGAWQWIRLETVTGVTEVPFPERYLVTLGEDGRFGFRADCNRGSGEWSTPSAGSVDLTCGVMTKMLCPADSLDRTFLAGLNGASAAEVVEGTLRLTLPDDGGVYVFTPVQADVSDEPENPEAP